MLGTIRDASGAAIPGAKVVVSNTSKGITREITTTDGGLFSAPALVPASGYSITVSKAGFAPYEATNITVQVGENVTLNVALKVGAVAEKVDVTAGAEIVDDAKTEMSDVVNNQMISDLPINGRRVDQFVLLTPAVTSDATFGLLTFRGMAGGNAFLIDGNDTTNSYYNENAGRTRLGAQISQDAIQEFQVLNNSYSAEFGGASGGTVNTITKSGTNGFHGTAFWFFRNRTLDAIDRFSIINGSPFNPPEVRHQPGGTIGGPLVKDKLFFFFNTEFQYRVFPMVDTISGNANVNTATQTFNGCTASAAACAAANAYLPRLFGLVPRNGNQSLYFLKLDYRPNERNSVSLSINYLKWKSMNGIQTGIVSTSGAAVGTNGDDSVRDRIGKASWTWVPKNNIVNEARFGWFKDRQADDFNPGLQAGYPIGNVSLSVGGISTLGGYNVLPRINPSEQRFQFADNISWIKGHHSFKFGIDIANTEDYTNNLSTQYGSYTYASSAAGVTAFANDLSHKGVGPSGYTSFSQVFGNPIIDTTVTAYGFYAEDTWKVTPKLTANLGLRYEYSVLPQPKIVNPFYPQTGVIPSAGKNFGPRIGLAYALNSKTVARIGYGIFYDRYETGLISNFFTLNNVYTQSLSFSSPTATGAPVFPNVLASPAGTAGSATIQFAAPDLRNPYTEQGNVSLERQLSKNTSLSVGYVWNRGKRLYTVRDLNIGPLSSTVFNYTILNSSLQPTGQVYSTNVYLFANRVDSRFSKINQVENGGKQWYDAMVVDLKKKFGYGFSGTVSYTWSHEIDLNQESGSNALFFSSGPMGLYNGNYSYDKGNGNLDQRHRLVSTFTAQPKFTKSNSAFAKYLINNWQWNGILTLASGRPSFESVSTSGLPSTLAFTTLNGLGGDTRVPFIENNPLRTDPVTRFDTRISKIIPIKEQMSLSLNFEVFNLTNTISNTSVASQGFSAGNKGTAAAPNLVIAPCTNPTAASGCIATTPGAGTASAGFPDGTNARRAQISLRFVF